MAPNPRSFSWIENKNSSVLLVPRSWKAAQWLWLELSRMRNHAKEVSQIYLEWEVHTTNCRTRSIETHWALMILTVGSKRTSLAIKCKWIWIPIQTHMLVKLRRKKTNLKMAMKTVIKCLTRKTDLKYLTMLIQALSNCTRSKRITSHQFRWLKLAWIDMMISTTRRMLRWQHRLIVFSKIREEWMRWWRFKDKSKPTWWLELKIWTRETSKMRCTKLGKLRNTRPRWRLMKKLPDNSMLSSRRPRWELMKKLQGNRMLSSMRPRWGLMRKLLGNSISSRWKELRPNKSRWKELWLWREPHLNKYRWRDHRYNRPNRSNRLQMLNTRTQLISKDSIKTFSSITSRWMQ